MEVSMLKSPKTPSTIISGSFPLVNEVVPRRRTASKAAGPFVPRWIVSPGTRPRMASSGFVIWSLFICVSVIFSTDPDMVFKLPVAYPTVIRESIGVIVFLWARALPLEVIRKKRLQIVSL